MKPSSKDVNIVEHIFNYCFNRRASMCGVFVNLLINFFINVDDTYGICYILI